jgi:hypothetical protein
MRLLCSGFPMSLWLSCGLHGFAVPNTVTVTVLPPHSVDIFFLDWEKPRRILAKGGGREEPGPISAWRTLLVANEWNELQTLRFTCPTFTLLTAVRAVWASRGFMLALQYPTLGLQCRRLYRTGYCVILSCGKVASKAGKT